MFFLENLDLFITTKIKIKTIKIQSNKCFIHSVSNNLSDFFLLTVIASTIWGHIFQCIILYLMYICIFIPTAGGNES
jgi:hypothetical protein